MKRWIWTKKVVILATLALAPVGAAWAETKVALVIGNGAYQNVSRLSNPVNDATDMGKKLKEIGFNQVEVKLNLNKSEMETELKKFGMKARQADIATLYYAGHGIEVGGQNYLIPVDARLAVDDDVELEAISLSIVQTVVRGAHKLRLVILDACRDNPFAATMSSSGGGRNVGRGFSRIEPTSGTLVAYAAKEKTIAADGSGRNSPYTAALLKHIGVPGLDVQMMFRRVRDDVLKTTDNKQEPHEYGSLPGGNFYLVLPVVAPVVAADTETVADPRATSSFDEDAELCASLKNSKSIGAMEEYLKTFSGGKCAKLIKIRLTELKESADPPPSTESKRFSLTVETTPPGAKIRIGSIKEPYKPGIRLKPGNYELTISHPGYISQKRSVELNEADKELAVVLEQEEVAEPVAVNAKTTARSKKPLPSPKEEREINGIPFVWVPGGTFTMGQSREEQAYLKERFGEQSYQANSSDEQKNGDAYPMTVGSLWISQFEITVAQFRQFVEATNYRSDAEKNMSGNSGCWGLTTNKTWEYVAGRDWREPGYPQRDNFPVVCVSFHDAQAYVDWLNTQPEQPGIFRMLTEAEWEHAARGGTDSWHYWGNDPEQKNACGFANVTDNPSGWAGMFDCSDGYYYAAPVGQFRGNNFGLQDMLGNVSEWSCSVYEEKSGREASRCPGKNDPQFASGFRGLRGGAWSNNPWDIRPASRYGNEPHGRGNYMGIRIAFEPK